MLIVFREYAKGTGVEDLKRMFGIPEERVSYQPNWEHRLRLPPDHRRRLSDML